MPVSPARYRPAAFLDRDGTLMVDPGYVGRPEQVQLLSDVVEGLRRLSDAGYALVVVTNQSGVHRGYFGMPEVEAVNERLDELLRREGINLSAFYTCPHGPDTGCECRKPGPGLGRQAADELGLDLSRSIVIGDKESDVGLGVALGARTILLAECGTDSCADLIVPDWKSLVREVEPWLARAADGKHMAVSV